MTDTQTQGDRDQINFISVDSAPKKFAGFVSIWRGPSMLVSFCVVAFALLWMVNTPLLSEVFPNRDFVFSPYEGRHAIAIRIFILSFFVTFAAFCSASPWGKFLFALDMIVSFGLICALLDLANAASYHYLGLAYSLHLSAILTGLLGFAYYSFKLLERGFMPMRIRVEHRPVSNRRAIFRLCAVTLIAGFVSIYVGSLKLELVEHMRQLTLLGGIGPGVFLFLPVLFGLLYLIAIIDTYRMKQPRYTPSVSIIVPAHNEEYIIKDTIEAMDKAAAHYGGDVHILIMNNNSTDGTEQIATDVLNACTSAKGRVINVPKPGKSNALNAGLDAAETEFLIRVDADTLIGEDNLSRAMPYFSDPAVGVVGGVPIPPGGALFDRPRLLEVLVKHGFYSVAMGAVNGVVGIPGMFVVLRSEHPRYLGGFVEGMNGEDTDMSLRIGELGFHSVVDPKIRYISEVPASYTHMREQRMRWFRSVYHISSRCRDLIYSDRLSLRGKLILPYMLINSGRRAMLIPLMLFGALEYLGGFNPDSPLIWQSVIAVAIGAPAIVACVAAFLNGLPMAIVALPEYLIFRLLRSYFTLESMMSILIRTEGQKQEHAFKKDIVSTSPVRVA